MEVIFLPDAQDDLDYWIKTGNKSVLKKIANLVQSIKDTPSSGIGKPEKLKHSLTGTWSRRINHEHRIIYEIVDDKILIHSVKGHYE
jgi:toxin YoeB